MQECFLLSTGSLPNTASPYLQLTGRRQRKETNSRRAMKIQKVTLDLEAIRYIFHREHEHPLILCHMTETEFGNGSCRSCKVPSSGLTFRCSRCEFYLHKLCTGNPDQVENPLHHHPLTRDFCTGSRCNSCDSTYNSRSNFYKCSGCKFSLDQNCALAMPSFSKRDPHRLVCQLCHSAILLIEKEEDDQELCCTVCHNHCSGPAYSCPSCNFFLHKSCSNGLSEVQHPSHPFLPLKRTKMHMFKCNNCHEDSYSTSYHCEECDFDLDFKCAFLVPWKEFSGRETILTGLHRHPWELTDKSTGRNDNCIVCYEPCPQLTYGCRGSEFFINVHKSCATAQMPQFLYDTCFHGRRLKRSFGSFTCKACQNYRTGFCYEPSDSGSDFKLDVRCAYLERPHIIYEGHSHPLIYLEDFDGQTMCNACGKPCTPFAFHCLICGIKLHLFCGPLPCSIKQETHIEILVLKDYLVEDVREDDDYYCDSCEERRDPYECIYYCARCNYCAEIKCVMPELKHALMGMSGDVELRTLGRWSRSGKLLSKGLLQEEMQQQGTGKITTDTKAGCCLRDITRSLSEDEMSGLDNIFNSSEKLFEDLSKDGDMIQDACPYSDEFLQLVQRLDSIQLVDLKKSWEPGMRLVHVGEYLVPEQLLHVYNDLYQKYGDLSAETTLSPNQKALLFLPLCQAIEGICSTKVVDITECELIKWLISIKAVCRAGFKIQFAVDALRIVVRAYYGLLFCSNLDHEIRSLEEEIPKNKATLAKLKGELKRHKEYFESEEPSLVKECMKEASLMYQTAGKVVLP